MEKNYDLLLSKEFVDKSLISVIKQDTINPTSFHAHDFIEILYLPYGGGYHRIGDHSHLVEPGEISILNFGVPHQLIPAENQNMIVYNCIFKPEFIDFSLINSLDFNDITTTFLLQSLTVEEPVSYHSVNSGVHNEYIKWLFDQMVDEHYSFRLGRTEILRGYVILLIVTLFRIIKEQSVESGNMVKSSIIDSTLDYIKRNFSSDLSLKDLSMLCFLSPSYFSKVFKDTTGMTVTNFIQNIRIKEACKMLETTNATITNIAWEVGYSDVHHFINIFKRITGTTPCKYRRKSAGE